MSEKILLIQRHETVLLDGLDDSERQPCEVWTRVMGYYRPTFAYNPGKKQEFDDRVSFTEEMSGNKLTGD